MQLYNESAEFARWNLLELILTTSLIRLKLTFKPREESLARGSNAASVIESRFMSSQMREEELGTLVTLSAPDFNFHICN